MLGAETAELVALPMDNGLAVTLAPEGLDFQDLVRPGRAQRVAVAVAGSMQGVWRHLAPHQARNPG